VSEMPGTVLDVREIPPRERHSRIMQAFEGLAEGGEMILTVDHEPKPLLYQFQAERPGGFDWSVLEEGPEIWRILIGRHAASDRKGHSAMAYLGWDHDRLEGLLSGYLEAFQTKRWEEAKRRFSEFETGLRRHIRMEEQVLFPAFEISTGMGESGPTAVMRQEHRRIEHFLGEIGKAVSDPEGRAGDFEGLHRELIRLLGEHNAKEEHVIYPLTDRNHVPADRDALIRCLQLV
jgi:uncharacterized protein (DUF2249 family)/hemerythrin-like domain-containing protein